MRVAPKALGTTEEMTDGLWPDLELRHWSGFRQLIGRKRTSGIGTFGVEF